MSNLNISVVKFAYNLFIFFIKHNDDEKKENVIFSPYSIHNLLSMVLNGTTGSTTQEIKKILTNDESTDCKSLNNEHFNLLQNVNEFKQNSNINLQIDNFIFYNQDIELNKKFQDKTSKCYETKIKSFDISKKSKSLKLINGLISKSTNDLIPEMILELPQNTKLIIVNTIYFKGKWQTQFDNDETIKKDFNCIDETVKVDMMHKKDDLFHMENEFFVALKMPYEDPQFSLMIFLPKEGVSINEISKFISDENFYSDLSKYMSLKEVDLNLPKFKISSKINLKNALNYFGLKNIFFNGTSELQHIMCDNTMNDVKIEQKAVIEINESGSEAAAATAMLMGRCAFIEKEFVKMNVNRPFCFSLIYNNNSDIPLPLFMGKVENPLKE
ncbi:proteinase inhibitor i4 serpin [Vairimorpha apis BRL 01]|uniref:Proteinase inhibitor i4 serpin n=1 Tax=Vairimorpha apis BRL 01 TaxID=1037528 RepID=T0KXJ3_9MICR|nr:proteinase inhibitor i4 serpin [Vairimorpha apis BRL 01]